MKYTVWWDDPDEVVSLCFTENKGVKYKSSLFLAFYKPLSENGFNYDPLTTREELGVQLY